MQGTRERV